MLGFLAPKRDLEASLSGNDGDSHETLEAQWAYLSLQLKEVASCDSTNT